MQFIKISLLTSTAFVAAASVIPATVREPTPEALVADLSALKTSLKTLSSTVKSYQPGLAATANLNRVSKAVNVAVQRMDDDAERVKLPDTDSAQKVFDAIVATEPAIVETLNNIVAKRTTFGSVVKPQVSQSLDKLVVNTLSLGKKLESQVPPDFAPKIKEETDKLETSFKKAQADFRT